MTHTHAVVLGGSMAGLLTARVLTEHFERVTIVERDSPTGGWTGDPHADPREREVRRGVPQGRHAHGLLAAGLNVIERLFPGATRELAAAGMPTGDVLGNVRFCANGYRLKQVPAGMDAVSFSRPYLETWIRSKVFALPGVAVRGGHDIVGIEADAARTRVIGARIQAAGEPAETLTADLVVDATGKGSRAPRWLAELGYERPREERLQVDLAYVSRPYRVDPALLDGDIAIIIGPSVAAPRGGAVMLQEGGRAVITLFGILGDHSPLDDAGYRAYAKRLPLPYVSDIIEASEPLAAEAVKYRFPGSTRHRYDRLRRFPQGFVVLGDAMCSFNPMYGQGMSVAGIEALKLGSLLERGELDALRFFREVKPVVDIPWQIATGGDAALPGVQGGPKDIGTRMVNRYLNRLYAAAEHDEVVSLAFSRVTNLLDPPTALMRPRIARRVLGRRRLAAA
ncbi:FAD-binding monooxygenase [Dactylosporangium vinaceum]|uniref:FAD-dependent oxidoreductase n=1 Tax=Dactylosporangium vinaceum TaxID=53362 RepID=A0ABV5MBA4_9ACTN|nr:FAD-binding monooxygenase [Dactylosporangium vinaceum]UAB98382.1 FAD-binding monooxygenase [Dactylosporangium vinaceum]